MTKIKYLTSIVLHAAPESCSNYTTSAKIPVGFFDFSMQQLVPVFSCKRKGYYQHRRFLKLTRYWKSIQCKNTHPCETGAIINVPIPDPQTAIPVAKALFFSKYIDTQTMAGR